MARIAWVRREDEAYQGHKAKLEVMLEKTGLEEGCGKCSVETKG